jgi:hypothetical protein
MHSVFSSLSGQPERERDRGERERRKGGIGERERLVLMWVVLLLLGGNTACLLSGVPSWTSIHMVLPWWYQSPSLTSHLPQGTLRHLSHSPAILESKQKSQYWFSLAKPESHAQPWTRPWGPGHDWRRTGGVVGRQGTLKRNQGC